MAVYLPSLLQRGILLDAQNLLRLLHAHLPRLEPRADVLCRHARLCSICAQRASDSHAQTPVLRMEALSHCAPLNRVRCTLRLSDSRQSECCSLTTACRYACAAALKSTPPPATKRLARMRAAWSRHGTVSDQDAQLYCCALRIQECAVRACAGSAPCSARSSERDVLHAHHHSILRKWSQEAVPAAQWH